MAKLQEWHYLGKKIEKKLKEKKSDFFEDIYIKK